MPGSCPALSRKMLTSLPSSDCFCLFGGNILSLWEIEEKCISISLLFVLICFLLQVSDFILSPPLASPKVMLVGITVGIMGWFKVHICYLSAEKTFHHILMCFPATPCPVASINAGAEG